MAFYLLLALAIVAEIIATTYLKYSEGFTKLMPSLICMVFYMVCHVSFSKAITRIHLGIAYATWCGVGIVVTALISFFVFKEKLSTSSIMGLALVIAGCMIVNLSGTGHG